MIIIITISKLQVISGEGIYVLLMPVNALRRCARILINI